MDPSSEETFAERLRRIMDERAITQVDLGRVVGVSQTTISRWLTGSIPTKPRIKRIAIHYDLDEFWLLTGLGRRELPLTERLSQKKATERRVRKVHDYVESVEKPRRVIHIQHDTSSHRDMFQFDRASEEDWAYVVKTIKDYCAKAKAGDASAR